MIFQLCGVEASWSLGNPQNQRNQRIEAMDVFESLKKSGAELNSVVYNTVLDVRDTQLPAKKSW